MEQNYTTLQEFLSSLVAIPVTELHPISSGYQNSIFEFKKKEGSYILRITSEQHRSRSMVEGEIKLLDHLATKGQAISNSIPFHSGDRVEEFIEGKERFFVTMFSKAPGRPVNVSDLSAWNSGFFRLWGGTLGDLHRNTSGLNKNLVGRQDWLEFSAKDGMDKKVLSEISSLSINSNVYGLIHNDFHHGNFFVDDSMITIFDFDDCAYGWFANDIAVAIYHAMWNGISEHPEWKDFEDIFINSFLEGYFENFPYHKEIVTYISLFIRYRDIFLYQLFQKRWPLDELKPWQKYTLEAMIDRIKNDRPIIDFDFTRI